MLKTRLLEMLPISEEDLDIAIEDAGFDSENSEISDELAQDILNRFSAPQLALNPSELDEVELPPTDENNPIAQLYQLEISQMVKGIARKDVQTALNKRHQRLQAMLVR